MSYPVSLHTWTMAIDGAHTHFVTLERKAVSAFTACTWSGVEQQAGILLAWGAILSFFDADQSAHVIAVTMHQRVLRAYECRKQSRITLGSYSSQPWIASLRLHHCQAQVQTYAGSCCAEHAPRSQT